METDSVRDGLTHKAALAAGFRDCDREGRPAHGAWPGGVGSMRVLVGRNRATKGNAHPGSNRRRTCLLEPGRHLLAGGFPKLLQTANIKQHLTSSSRSPSAGGPVPVNQAATSSLVAASLVSSGECFSRALGSHT